MRLAVRQLFKSPGFAATAVLMLAFGIGATTAIFSVVDGILLRPLPFPHSEQLVTLGDQVSGTAWGKSSAGPVTGPEAVMYARDLHSFQNLGAYAWYGFEISGIGEPVQVVATRITPSLLAALEVEPLMGRLFTEEEDRQRQLVTLLSFITWKERFHGDPDIVGKKVLLDRKPYVIVGVMPRGFEFPLFPGRQNRSELWVPMSFSAQEISPAASSTWYLAMVGRLKPNVTIEQAQDDADRLEEQMLKNSPWAGHLRVRPVLNPLQQITVAQARPMLRMLFWAVAVVLLIACANLAGLLLVRAIHRQREIAVRLAIGASGMTLLRQMILESLALTVTGGLLGIGLAAIAIAIGRNYLPETIPLENTITLNWAVVGFALLLAVATGILCGLAPGFATLRTNVNAALKEGGRSGSAGGNHARLRSVLVVLEIAIAIVLLTTSGLLLRSFQAMTDVDLGFRADHVAIAAYGLPPEQYGTQAQIDSFNGQLMERLQRTPGAEAVALTDNSLPTMGLSREACMVDGYAGPTGTGQLSAASVGVIGDYFRVLKISLLRGRYFTEGDNADGQLVAIVDHKFAEHYWPHEDPIGKRIRLGTPRSDTPWETVVGEVADVRADGADRDTREVFYQPVAQLRKDRGSMATPADLVGNSAYVLLRATLPAEQMEAAIRAAVRSLDPQQALTQVETMDDVVAQSQAPRRFNAVILSTFALAAVLLAVLGIYSVIAFSVASRVQEMAIRMALGSQRADIMRLILTSGLKLAAAGCVLGLAGAAAVSRVLSSFLFHVSPFDPLVLAVTAIVVFALAIMASAIPARRAASIDPLRALRGE